MEKLKNLLLNFLFDFRSIISSEISEEDLEQWFKSSNFSGFEDFVSPSNFINFLLRFVIGEVRFLFDYHFILSYEKFIDVLSETKNCLFAAVRTVRSKWIR